jgi:RNA polymerase sigma factor (sigma-70 family)
LNKGHNKTDAVKAGAITYLDIFIQKTIDPNAIMHIKANTCYTSAVLSAVILANIDAAWTVAFVPNSRSQHTRRIRNNDVQATIFLTDTYLGTTTQPVNDAYVVDILEDGKGHINPELAQRIWTWEKQQRLNLDSPDFENYSTRAGLRWVKEMVKSTLKSSNVASTTATTTTSSPNPQRRSLYDDLIQEGVIGLMQALKKFEHQSRPNESFESFAKTQIRIALEAFTLERDKGMGTPTGTGKRRPLSMETTIEIADPLETENYYYNQDEWEIREGLVLDNGKSVRREDLVEVFLDEATQYEGEDQMWIQSQSIAAPLRDSIPESIDNSEDSIMDGILKENQTTSPDDLALTDMILYNVDDFLGNTLDDIESQIIQMRFGLDDGTPKTQKEISYDLNLTVSKVRKLQKLALSKLRAKFTERYIIDDTGHEDFWEDTV